MENGFLCQNSILSSKMQYLLSLQLKSLLYLVIFNTQTIPYKKTIKYIAHTFLRLEDSSHDNLSSSVLFSLSIILNAIFFAKL